MTGERGACMAIKIIPANPSYQRKKAAVSAKIRAAAYCRVSTLLEEQETSYEAQVHYYTRYITSHPDWLLAGIYADEGISGTETRKRTEFNRMIEDCLSGNIDLVITKSISRFARNTLDCLKYIRLLKEKDIPVYFEKEGINTLDAKGEVLITIMASLAQQESQSISQNVRMGIQYQYQLGKVRLNYSRFLGYTRNAAGKLVIVPEEAQVVNRIFKEFLDGSSPRQIARDLMRDQIKTCTGGTKWYESTIRSMLKNEKYRGDALLQKVFIADYLTKRRVKNTGYLPQYYVEDDHPAIISKEMFSQVQEELEKRSRTLPVKPGTSTYAFSGKVYCSCCDNTYRRVKANGKNKFTTWRCKTRMKNGSACHGRILKEIIIQTAVMEALDHLAQRDPTWPKISQFQEATMEKILERIDVRENELEIKFKGLESIIVFL